MIDIFETFILQWDAHTLQKLTTYAHISFTPKHLATITLRQATS